MSVVDADDDDDAKIAPLPSNSVLAGLRDSAVQCRELLHELSTSEDAATHEAEEMMAAFNILAANMGIFRQGQYSLASRLQNAPEFAKLAGQLLHALQRHLVQTLAECSSRYGRKDDDASCSGESDDSSDRSSAILGRHHISEGIDQDDNSHVEQGPSTALASARGTINSLRQLSLTLRLAGAQHRYQRIQRFRNHETYSQIFEGFHRYALQRARYLFPRAPAFLTDRIAESIASRRIRFLYLERHQTKISTMNQPAPALSLVKQREEEKPAAGYVGQSELKRDLPHSRVQPATIMSSTVHTKFEHKGLHAAAHPKPGRSESVSSMDVSHAEFPKMPNLDAGGLSFTCPYCTLVCPVRDAERNHHDTLTAHRDATVDKTQDIERLEKSQWRNHLIRDFEPFFCVLEDCSSPFACADTYSGWLAHMKNMHSPLTWRCWHCRSDATDFPSPGELDSHLQERHKHEVSDAQRDSLIKQSIIQKQHALQSCPFCGGFPENIEKQFSDRQSSQAQDLLIAHVKEHLILTALILAPTRIEETSDEAISSDINSGVPVRCSDDVHDSNTRGESGWDPDEQSMIDTSSNQVPLHDVPNAMETNPDWTLQDAGLITAISETWLEVKKCKQDSEAGLNESEWLEQSVIKAFLQRFRQSETRNPSPLPIASQSPYDFGADQSDDLVSMANLALTYRNQGRLTEAEELAVRVMETSLRLFGEEHPDTLTSMANLASTYRDLGRWKEAERLEARVTKTRERLQDPDTASANRAAKDMSFPIPRKPVNKPENRVLIVVFGMTGTGKTSLIKSLAGEAASQCGIRHDLEPCTQEIETVDFLLDGHRVTLVDTPGFDDTKRSETEILKLIADWLQYSYNNETPLSGLIYLHRISDVRMSGPSLKNMRMFRKVCGIENMSKVCLMTTMWDKITLQDGISKENDLKRSNYWSRMIASGCSIKRHDRGSESARDVIRGMLTEKPNAVTLQEEMMVAGKNLVETKSGMAIDEETGRLGRKHDEDLEESRTQMKEANRKRNTEPTAQRRKELIQAISELEKQMKEEKQLVKARYAQLENHIEVLIIDKKAGMREMDSLKEENRRLRAELELTRARVSPERLKRTGRTPIAREPQDSGREIQSFNT